MTINLLESLLRTKALNFPPPDEVFWYTSGTVGPYYINTHYLFGSQRDADQLLEMINVEKDHPEFPVRLRERVSQQYADNSIYRSIVDSLVDLIQRESPHEFDVISGGERRDWFFSLAVAERLGKPHLFIFKDLKKVLLNGMDIEREELSGINTLHVADLVTEASSYFRSWIPAVSADGGTIIYSANVIDRGQGGIEALRQKGVESNALLCIDKSLFSKLLGSGTISVAQAKLFEAYHEDPYSAMRDFLIAHPDFIDLALKTDDPKIRQRAELFLEKDPYQIGSNPV
ncbi:MAG: orotate phosphoribosyltransferase [Candidatus Latescibacterota bacterium]|nr:orotate phosphoribosyltransferase [Candidatus Latescibacterota bacterium]